MNRIFRSVLVLTFLTAAAAAQSKPSSPAEKPVDSKAAQSSPRKVDRAAAYYHYTLAHMYEEQITIYGRSELANKAMDEYRLAIEADPSSEFLTSALAELYVKTGRIRDAVLEAQDIIKRDPNNLEAHKLLGRIYLRSLGDLPGSGNNGSDNVLKLAIEQYEQIVKIEPNNVDNHLLLGRLYRLNNDLQKAENELKTAVKLDPDSEEAITTLSLLYTDEGDSAHALQVLSSVPDTRRSAKLYAALGATYEQRKEFKSAIDAYKHAIQLDRDNLDAIRGLAENLLNDGQIDAALDQYKVIADANPEDAQTYLRISEIYRRQGKYEEALERLKKAQTMVPDALEVPYNIAVVYQAQTRYDEAAKVLQDLLKKTEKAENSYSQADRNNRAIFIERLGMVYRDQENYSAAVEAFRKMIPFGDDNARTGYQDVIDTYREAKQWQQATAAAKEAVQKLPNDRELRMVLDAQLADTGDPEKPLADVRSLLKGTPDDREVYLRLSIMYTRLKRWSDAEEALNKTEQLSTKSEDKENVYFLRGSTYEREKKYDQAEAEFRKILALNPQNAATLNYLGYMNADRDVRLEESLNYVKQAVSVEPTNGAYLDSLGWAYFKLGKFDLAEENLAKASLRMGSDPTVQDHLGDLYQKTGRLKLAAAHWERAVQEWNRTVAAEVDTDLFAATQKKLDAAKVRLAKEGSGNQ
ncbi:MAG TPA: tetratricopeptide repeat protein [Candidatus Acidoferrum sp.]|jgi:tetratricopeptide (TPR) repeat protein|nr:tetratricopeptide repeat protein [Candidatus Acidoferrum sp.]